MQNKSPLITLNNIGKQYPIADQVCVALQQINLSIEAGQMVALMGASGSGKTTAMQIMGLLDTPTQGEYQLAGQVVSGLSRDARAIIRNKKIGFVFQSFFLLPRLKAWENVALPLMYRDLSIREIKQRAMAELDKVGLADRMEHHPSQLSGGQQQRVAIARALVTEPDIILADEPTGALDSETGDLIMRLLHDCNGQGHTMIIVTHDVSIAKQCGRVIRIADGKIVDDLSQ